MSWRVIARVVMMNPGSKLLYHLHPTSSFN